jgi:hypothetical protein
MSDRYQHIFLFGAKQEVDKCSLRMRIHMILVKANQARHTQVCSGLIG